MAYLQPKACACIIEAQHFCMKARGVGKQNSMMVTSSLEGSFLDDTTQGHASRQELMDLIRG